jgi:hypothetical protein
MEFAETIEIRGNGQNLGRGLLEKKVPAGASLARAIFLDKGLGLHPRWHLIGTMAGVLFWRVLCGGAILSPDMRGAATGLLAGLVGTSVLEIHPPIWMHGTFWYHTSASRSCALWSVLSQDWRAKSFADFRFSVGNKTLEHQ